MKIREIGSYPVAIVPKDATLAEAAAMMREFHVGDVVVVESNNEKARPVGIQIIHAADKA